MGNGQSRLRTKQGRCQKWSVKGIVSDKTFGGTGGGESLQERGAVKPHEKYFYFTGGKGPSRG